MDDVERDSQWLPPDKAPSPSMRYNAFAVSLYALCIPSLYLFHAVSVEESQIWKTNNHQSPAVYVYCWGGLQAAAHILHPTGTASGESICKLVWGTNH